MNFIAKRVNVKMIYIDHTQTVTFVEIYSIHVKSSRLLFKNNKCLQHTFFEHLLNVYCNCSILYIKNIPLNNMLNTC